MRLLLRLIAGIVLLLVVGVAILLAPSSDPRLPLAAKEPFSRGTYMAYLQPWGAEQVSGMRWWSRHADSMLIDQANFPNNSEIAWRWPPFRPTGVEAGVWGYDIVAFGDYDGGTTETKVRPRRIRDIRALSQAFSWRYKSYFGDANVLTEFYLRSDPAKVESKLIEIGWLLHAPPASAAFAAAGKPIGTWLDADRRRWQVTINDRYLLFVPVGGGDLTTGRIDMLAALRWLQAKGVVTGDAWFSGVAIGAEPVTGWGRLHIDRWSVTYR